MEDIESYLRDIDQVSAQALADGANLSELAGALLARVHHYYLMRDPSDLEGLEQLLKHALEQIQNRPRWDID